MKTYQAKPHEIDRKWFLVDARERTLGRMAAEIAHILRGKHKAEFTPHVDTGDFVVVINADKIHLTGKKWKDKVYYHYSGYPGGIKSITAEKLHAKRPEELVRKAIKGMLPKNPLGRKMFKKLKVYTGEEHPHQAQKPELLSL